jgi:hypothetical protein
MTRRAFISIAALWSFIDRLWSLFRRERVELAKPVSPWADDIASWQPSGNRPRRILIDGTSPIRGESVAVVYFDEAIDARQWFGDK